MNWSPVYVCLLLDQQLKQVEVELNWKAQKCGTRRQFACLTAPSTRNKSVNSAAFGYSVFTKIATPQFI